MAGIGSSIKDRANYGVDKFQNSFTENDATKLWTAQIRGAARETRDLLRHLWNLDAFDTISLSPNASVFKAQYAITMKNIEDSFDAAYKGSKENGVTFDMLEKVLNSIVSVATLLADDVQDKKPSQEAPQSPRAEKALGSRELSSLNSLREIALLRLRKLLEKSWIDNKDIPAKNAQLAFGVGTPIRDRINYPISKLENSFTQKDCNALWKEHIRGALREAKALFDQLWNLGTFDTIALTPSKEKFERQYKAIGAGVDQAYSGGKLDSCSYTKLDDALEAIGGIASLLLQVESSAKASPNEAAEDIAAQKSLLEELNGLRAEALPKIETLLSKEWIRNRKIGELNVNLSPIAMNTVRQQLEHIHSLISKEFLAMIPKPGLSICQAIFASYLQNLVGTIEELLGGLLSTLPKIKEIELPDNFANDGAKIRRDIQTQGYASYDKKSCSPESLKKLMLLVGDAADLLLDIGMLQKAEAQQLPAGVPEKGKKPGFATDIDTWRDGEKTLVKILAEGDPSTLKMKLRSNKQELLGLFGLPENATQADLNTAYKKNVLLYWHPDKYVDIQAKSMARMTDDAAKIADHKKESYKIATEVTKIVNTIKESLMPVLPQQ